MTDLLATVHMWLGYIAFVVVVVAAVTAFRHAKDGREFARAPYSGALVLLDVQVLLGLIVYAVGGYWDARPEIAYVHPGLALAALGVGHALLGRSRKVQLAADAHRLAGRGLVGALVLLLLAIGVASAPAFL